MKRTFFFLFILLLLSSIPAEAQCSMCRAVLESQASQDTAEGINKGIIYLMVFPYLLIGGVGYFIWRSRRNKKPTSE